MSSTKRSTLKDLTGALILLLVAVGYYLLANDINQTALDDEIGAGGLPRLYAILLGTIAVALGVKALIVRRFIPADGHATNDRPGPVGDGRALVRAAGMLMIGIAYVAVVTLGGYLISLGAAIALVALYLGEPAGWRLVRIAIGGALAFWILFDRILGIDTPPGFWPGLWRG